jgi:hypothetical protein
VAAGYLAAFLMLASGARAVTSDPLATPVEKAAASAIFLSITALMLLIAGAMDTDIGLGVGIVMSATIYTAVAATLASTIVAQGRPELAKTYADIGDTTPIIIALIGLLLALYKFRAVLAEGLGLDEPPREEEEMEAHT